MLRVEELATISFTLKLEVACYRQIRYIKNTVIMVVAYCANRLNLLEKQVSLKILSGNSK